MSSLSQPTIENRPSPNHGARREGPTDMVVLHYTAMVDLEGAAARLCDPAAEVSAHYLIGRDGRVVRLVDETRRAWHAGRARWGDVEDVNSRSIGIELDHEGAALDPSPPFAEPQMQALEALLAGIVTRHAIPAARVVGHACIAPGRKRDPGPKFDWRRLALRGLAIWQDPPAQAVATPDVPGAPMRLARALRRLGYPVAAGDLDAVDWTSSLMEVWQAFAMRFLPMRSGDAFVGPDAVAHAEALAAHFPCSDRAADLTI